uniref:Uncharacterized protein n=1 Tax=Lotus japonicus TaxID=34305 RepID=I3S1H4_LOTJA|nr:unknown [Lotus japonicus]
MVRILVLQIHNNGERIKDDSRAIDQNRNTANRVELEKLRVRLFSLQQIDWFVLIFEPFEVESNSDSEGTRAPPI